MRNALNGGCVSVESIAGDADVIEVSDIRAVPSAGLAQDDFATFIQLLRSEIRLIE
jgi:hypothetical protein